MVFIVIGYCQFNTVYTIYCLRITILSGANYIWVKEPSRIFTERHTPHKLCQLSEY